MRDKALRADNGSVYLAESNRSSIPALLMRQQGVVNRRELILLALFHRPKQMLPRLKHEVPDCLRSAGGSAYHTPLPSPLLPPRSSILLLEHSLKINLPPAYLTDVRYPRATLAGQEKIQKSELE